MSRPVKNYCDYFPHDRDMRNHRKVKAIRTKFGISGYAVWVMTLEYLTGSDGNVLHYDDTEFELLGGDYGVSAPEIRSVVDYCVSLELLFLKDGFIHSESLDERLKPVYEKRGVNKVKSSKQRRDHGKFIPNNTVADGVSVTEKPQMKLNESIVNKSTIVSKSITAAEQQPQIGIEKVKEIANNVWKDQGWKEQIAMGLSITIAELKKWMAQFNSSVADDNILDFNNARYKRMIRGWISKQQGKGITVETGATKKSDSAPLKKLHN